ncbi:MAG: hypothetical protein JRJ47_13885 [Deltaproteobacteria bacterium]|nr:hypothetical protein [Deltaproteobacteria bacterium]
MDLGPEEVIEDINFLMKYSLLAPPAAPTDLSATAVLESDIALNWQDRSDNEEWFKVERSMDSIDFSEISYVGANITGYTDSNLLSDTTYYYRVRASNEGGNSAYSNIALATTLSPPPNLPPVADVGDNQVVYDTVTLDASGSQDPDGMIVSYEWVLEHKDNSDYSRVIVSVTPLVVVSDLEHGFYFVTLTVTDNQGGIATDDMLLGANHQCGP